MEDKQQKSLVPFNVALVANRINLKGKRPFRGKYAEEGFHAPYNSQPKKGIAKKQQTKNNGEKNIACVKCYNYGMKGHFAQDCAELT